MSLTELKIKKVKAKEKKYKLYDSDYLYLEVYPNEKKQFMYKYKNKKEFKIGNYPAISLKEARQKRNLLKREIELIGLDEVVRKLQELKTQPKRNFDNVVNEWKIIYSKGKAPATIKKTIERLNKYIIPTFKGKDISKITIKEIYSLFKKVEKPTAEKLKSILNGLFNYAISKEYIKHNIIKDIDLKQIFQTIPKTKNHYSFITDLKEIKIYFRELEDLEDKTIIKGAIKIIWLTALRQGSVRAIKWEHINFDDKTLFIPKENLKVKARDFIIPLSDEAVKTFKELEKIKKSNFVFYSSNYKKPISESSLRKFQKDISIKYNISYQTLHGIRHTFATLTRQYIQKENNIPDEVIELSLQHLDKNSIREIYNHYDYLEERRELLNLWEKFLLSL